MQNITLYIGDNAIGKTRILKHIINKEKQENKIVVTNIENYGLKNYTIDSKKLSRVSEVSNPLVDRIIINKEINTPADDEVNNLLKLLYAQGDILVLDELDASITSQDIVHISMIISEIKDTWEKIYVTGYNEYLLRLFTTINKNNDTQTHEYNVYCIEGNMQRRKLREGEILEYIDSIRG